MRRCDFSLIPQKEEVCLKQKHFIYFLQSISVFLSSTKNNQPVKYFPLVQVFSSNSFTHDLFNVSVLLNVLIILLRQMPALFYFAVFIWMYGCECFKELVTL